PRVSHVFSVSGGSILAAHMAQHWDQYKSNDPIVFRRASNELVQFGLRDVRGRILRRWPLLGPFGLGRTTLLQHEYDRLFGGASLGTLTKGPKFHFLCTSLTRGSLCSFDRQSFSVVPADSDAPVEKYPADSVPLALAIAASSAFPPLFPPVKIARLPGVPARDFRGPEYLTDGGVYDNLGLSSVHRFLDAEEIDDLALIIASDASALFDEQPNRKRWHILARTARSTNILMERLAVIDREAWPLRSSTNVITLSIKRAVGAFESVPGYRYQPQDPTVQRLLKTVRTDLDLFNKELIRSLVMHGHEVAAEFFLGRDSSGEGESFSEKVGPWDPVPQGWPDEHFIELLATTGRIATTFAELEDALLRMEEAFGVSVDVGVDETWLQKLERDATEQNRRRQKELGLARRWSLGWFHVGRKG
ncbi:MAG: patatin-like phospholipase family protein, partial [Bacteroidetes bacterium]|nr:patatin-like phospholipase family protein [Bacteroidota bacterium]